MKKKLISMLLCSAMLVSLLAGCGSGGETPAADTQTDAETEAEAGTEAEGEAASDVTIKVAAIETAYGSDMWKEVCEAFTAETGIQVELTTDKNLRM